MKITVAEYREFLAAINSQWDDNWYVDGQEIDQGPNHDENIEDEKFVDSLAPTDIINFVGNEILMNREDEKKPPFSSTFSWFRSWKKQKTHSSVLVEIPRGQIDKLKAAVKKLGGKITA